MKLLILLAVFSAVIYSNQAYEFDLQLKVGIPYTYSIVGDIDVTISGLKKTEKFILEKTKMKYQQTINKSINFPEEEIQQVVITWHSNNQEVLQVRSFTALKKGSKSQKFIPEQGTYYLLNDESIKLLKL